MLFGWPMPAAYSLDLRERVIQNVSNGVDRREIARIFSISTATIQRWWSQYKNTSDVSPKLGYQKGHSHKIEDLNEFRAFVEENASLNLR